MTHDNMELPTQLFRLAVIELDGERSAGDGRVAVAISSETPYLRSFGYEVLDHSESAVDLSFAKRGAPVFVNHDGNDQVGVLEDVKLGTDRVMRGRVRFSKSARGQEIYQDVMDGIRPHISVGYSIQRMKAEPGDGDIKTFRATKWKPYEVSVVGVPADETVGVGRSAHTDATTVVEVDSVDNVDTGSLPEEKRAMADEVSPTPAPAPVVRDTSDETRSEMREINRLAQRHGMTDKVDGWFSRGLTAAQVAKEIIDGQEKAIAKGGKAKDVFGELSETEQRAYSLTRAIQADLNDDWRNAGLERAVSDAIAQDQPIQKGGFFVPLGMSTRTGQVAGTASVGGNLVFTEEQAFIELLRNRSVIAMAGARMLTGLNAPIAFPRQITAGAAAWRAENPGSDDTVTDSTFDQLTMSPKLVQRTVQISRQLIAQQGSGDVEALLRSDLAAVLALAMDYGAIQGGGSNEPVGILGNTNVNTVTLGTNGASVTLASLINLEKTVAEANADFGNLAFVTNPYQRAQMRQIQYFSGTNGVPMWSGGPGISGRLLAATGDGGYGAFVSNQVPKNLTKGTSTTICSGIIYGNWAELFVGQWGNGVEIVTDPFTKKRQALIELTAYLMTDTGLRHTASFAKIQDAL